MRLEGIHHVTCITGDAPANLRFYTGVLGLRLVKKTVNQDAPTIYHLFYADEDASSGADITFFEYPGAARGRAGAGMIHTIAWRVADEAALDFWQARLTAEGASVVRSDGRLRFADPEGLAHEFVIDASGDEPLRARHSGIPQDHALRGFDGVRAYALDPGASTALLEQTLGFARGADGTFEVRGSDRGGIYALDEGGGVGAGGAGTVHHVAFASTIDDHVLWGARVEAAGMTPSPIIDRFWFRSIYFREPSGVLFELATIGPGFATDEPADRLGESLSLPPAFEGYRAQIEARLTPLPAVER